MSQTNESVPPIVCTLGLESATEQVLEWTDLAPLARSRKEVEHGVTSTYPLSLAPQLEDLANREISCCGSWLAIDHKRADNEFELTLTTTNPEGLAMIRRMTGVE